MARSINQAVSVQEHLNASEPMSSKMKKLLIVIAFCSAIIPGASALDTAKIDNITGLKGTLNEKEGVYRIGFSRSDVAVAVDGSKMPPFMGARYLGGIHTRRAHRGDGDGRHRPF